MEMIKDVIIDFVLFSGIEGFIVCIFFQNIGKCRKFKWNEWLILSIGNCLLSTLFPPILHQIAYIVWMGLYLYLLNKTTINIFKGLKLSLTIMVVFYIVEVLYSIIIEYTMLYDMILSEDKFKVFLILFPTKFIEFIISLKGEKFMKLVVGGVVRK